MSTKCADKPNYVASERCNFQRVSYASEDTEARLHRLQIQIYLKLHVINDPIRWIIKAALVKHCFIYFMDLHKK